MGRERESCSSGRLNLSPQLSQAKPEQASANDIARNRNNLGVAPLKLKEVKPSVGSAKMAMVIGADD
jgi:hypothetical protein